MGIRNVFASIKFLVFFSLLALSPNIGICQGGSQSSRNGYILPVNGHIRVLLVFLEIKYTNGKDPCPAEGYDQWKTGKFPAWHKNLFDAQPSNNPKGLVTRFFHESSFGLFEVSGDILLNPEKPGSPFVLIDPENASPGAVLNEIFAQGKFLTMYNLPADSFDLWTMAKSKGQVKTSPSVDSPRRFDHVMIIVRNATYPPNGSGFANDGNVCIHKGFNTDTYSMFGSNNANPIQILLHEFNHLLIGGNNMHCCGGNHASSGAQLFLNFEGGWGMMGAANRSLMTCNGFDRWRLGWKLPDKEFYISARDSLNMYESDGNLVSEEFQYEQVYVLRDFVTTGDAIRIKLPFVPENEFQQYLWIENHQTHRFNGSPFDGFQYQIAECVEDAVPGIYMFMQIGRDTYNGDQTFSGYADYIRPLPANGMYDFKFGDTLVQNEWCVNNNKYFPFELRNSLANPLSGNHVEEIIAWDNDGDGLIREKEKREPAIEGVAGQYRYNLAYLGQSNHAYTLSGNSYLGMGSNPSSANMLTLVNDDKDILNGGPPNNRTIYLNGVSIEIIKQDAYDNGEIMVRVRFDDVVIRGQVRWCAPMIVLNPIKTKHGYSLILGRNSKLIIDQGLTPTRINEPLNFGGQSVFSSPTRLIVKSGAHIKLEKKSRLIITNGSEVIIEKGAKVEISKGAKIILKNGGKISYL